MKGENKINSEKLNAGYSNVENLIEHRIQRFNRPCNQLL